MNYETFIKIWDKCKNFDNADKMAVYLYSIEKSDLKYNDIVYIYNCHKLGIIYAVKNTNKKIVDICRLYNIPYRTLQNWIYRKNTKHYLIKMFCYALMR